MKKYKIGDHVVAGKCNIEEIHHSTGDTGVIIDISEGLEYPYNIQFDEHPGLILWCNVLRCVEDYKVGDHVIVKNSNIDEINGGTEDETGVITEILHSPGGFDYRVRFDKHRYRNIWCNLKGKVGEVKPKCKDDSLKIENVIFNDPATIVQWSDGSKTVVKCRGEEFDPEKGMAMAIAKKTLGDRYWDEFQKWVKHCKKSKKPLTLKQIKAMDGQKIWLSSIDDGKENFTDEYCGWYTVNVKDNDVYSPHCGRYKLDVGFKDIRWGYKAYYNDMSKEK